MEKCLEINKRAGWFISDPRVKPFNRVSIDIIEKTRISIFIR